MALSCPVLAFVIFAIEVLKLANAGELLYMVCRFVIIVVIPVESFGRIVHVKTMAPVGVASAGYMNVGFDEVMEFAEYVAGRLPSQLMTRLPLHMESRLTQKGVEVSLRIRLGIANM